MKIMHKGYSTSKPRPLQLIQELQEFVVERLETVDKLQEEILQLRKENDSLKKEVDSLKRQNLALKENYGKKPSLGAQM